MKIAIGSTRAGLTLKDKVKTFLEDGGHQVDDLGMQRDGEFVPYHKVAACIGRAVSRGEYPKAILICGTGAGSAIVANKFRGVYAVHASSEYEAKQAGVINNANVLTLGEWITPPEHGLQIVKAWLDAEFTEGFPPEWQDFLKNAYRQIQEEIERVQFAG